MNFMRAKMFLAIVVSTTSLVGCGPPPADYGETTDAFVGRLVQNGKPISLPADARLDLTHDDTYHKFGIPLNPDGSFEIGWMPTGKYSAQLVWMKDGAQEQSNASQGKYAVPNGLTIQKDSKQYEIELGEKWKR